MILPNFNYACDECGKQTPDCALEARRFYPPVGWKTVTDTSQPYKDSWKQFCCEQCRSDWMQAHAVRDI